MTQAAEWPAPFPLLGLLDVLTNLTGLQAVQLHSPEPMLGLDGGEQAWLKAVSSTSRELGVDEYRVQQNPNDPTGNTLQANVCGQRLYTVTIRAETLDSGPSPVSILERVRWGFRTQHGSDQLSALGIALSSFETIQHLGRQVSDERELIVAVLDVHFNWAVNFKPLFDDGTTIGLVNGGTQAPGTAFTITGTVGQPGVGGSTFSDNKLQITLPIGVASSTSSSTLIPAGAEVVDCQVIVQTPYSPGTTIMVGNSVILGLLQDSTTTPPDNIPTVADTYDKVQQTAWGSNPLPVTVTIGGTPAAGAGVVVVQYLVPGS